MSLNVIKTTSERYILKDRYWWVNINISNDGFLSIQSDYGNFSYAWNAFGPSFKKFLVECDDGYLYSKLGQGLPREFNAEKTYAQIKRDVIEMRRSNEITAEQAQKVWKQCKPPNVCTIEYEFCRMLDSYDSHLLEYIYSNDLTAVPMCTDRNHSLNQFLKECWPEFVKVIKEELNEKSDKIKLSRGEDARLKCITTKQT